MCARPVFKELLPRAWTLPALVRWRECLPCCSLRIFRPEVVRLWGSIPTMLLQCGNAARRKAGWRINQCPIAASDGEVKKHSSSSARSAPRPPCAPAYVVNQ